MRKLFALFLVFVLCACSLSSHKIERDNNSIQDELKNRYNTEFTIKEIIFDDEEDYSGFAYDEEGKSCYFLLNDGNLHDNYSIHYYEDDILSLINGYPKGGTVTVEYSVYGKRLEGKQDPKEFLYDSNVEIWFSTQVTRKNFLTVIRPWLNFLYDQDYKWYFEAYDGQILAFTLDPGDNGFTSSQDWSDEMLLRYVKN